MQAEAEEGRKVEISAVEKASEVLREMNLMVDSVSGGKRSLAR